jgi:hypothetical protein
MAVTVHIAQTLRVLEGGSQGAGGRTTVHRIASLQATGVERHDGKLLVLSAGLSVYAVDLTPITPSAAGQLLWIQCNQPTDVRLNASNAASISAVRSLLVAAAISSLFLTTVDSNTTTVRIEAMGGGSVQVNDPPT